MKATRLGFRRQALFLIGLLPASLISLLEVPQSQAQPAAAAVHSFTVTSGANSTNKDGVAPTGLLVLVGTNLYGTANLGGFYGKGSLFRVATNGSGFTNYHNFGLGSDGARPNGGLTVSGNKLYGTASEGAAHGTGGIFSINPDGTGYNNFYNFTAAISDPSHNFAATNSDGTYPFAGLVVVGNMVYGTAVSGGRMGAGTIFGVRTNGTGFTNLHNFDWISASTTNTEGASPYGTMILSGSTLYGLAYHGGAGAFGTLFAVSTNGTGFTNLHSFARVPADGGYPYGALLLADNVFYGTTSSAGSFGGGTVFKINTDGTGFATMHEFSSEPGGINSDGGDPVSTLILSRSTLVGVARSGGAYGNGTVFTINTNGNDFAAIFHFSNYDFNANTNAEGTNPNSGVILSGNTLYGTAAYGGGANAGTIFALTLPAPPILNLAPAGANVLISWPTAAVGYELQSTTGLLSGNWSAVTGGKEVVNTNFVFTRAINDPAMFFRLQR